MFLILLDVHSMCPLTSFLAGRSDNDVIEALRDCWYERPLPRLERLRCDDEKAFLSESVVAFVEQRGTVLDPIPPYSPQSIGRAEQVGGYIADDLQAQMELDGPQTWNSDDFRRALRASTARTTLSLEQAGYDPIEIMTGFRSTATDCTRAVEMASTPGGLAVTHRQRERTRDEINNLVAFFKQQGVWQRAAAYRGPRAHVFHVGDEVKWWGRKAEGRRSRWWGPARVVEVSDRSSRLLLRHAGKMHEVARVYCRPWLVVEGRSDLRVVNGMDDSAPNVDATNPMHQHDFGAAFLQRTPEPRLEGPSSSESSTPISTPNPDGSPILACYEGGGAATVGTPTEKHIADASVPLLNPSPTSPLSDDDLLLGSLSSLTLAPQGLRTDARGVDAEVISMPPDSPATLAQQRTASQQAARAFSAQLSKLNKAQLRERCNSAGLLILDDMAKSDLVNALVEALPRNVSATYPVSADGACIEDQLVLRVAAIKSPHSAGRVVVKRHDIDLNDPLWGAALGVEFTRLDHYGALEAFPNLDVLRSSLQPADAEQLQVLRPLLIATRDGDSIKVRFVIQGQGDETSYNPEDLFAPGLPFSVLAAFVAAHATASDERCLAIGDATAAYLQADGLPPRFAIVPTRSWLSFQRSKGRELPPSTVCLLRRPVYGLRPAGHLWGATFRTRLVNMGFRAVSLTDTALLDDCGTHMVVETDDVLISTSTDPEQLFTRLRETTDFGSLSVIARNQPFRFDGYNMVFGDKVFSVSLRSWWIPTLEAVQAVQALVGAGVKMHKWQTDDLVQTHPVLEPAYRRLAGIASWGSRTFPQLAQLASTAQSSGPRHRA
jgi:hypothetical protein